MGLTVLVVDDEDMLRETIAEMLEANGFTVLQAANGPRALEVLASRRVDYVLTDMQMPCMTGLELLITIRSQSNPPPVIMMSGNSKMTNDDFMKAGAYDVFQKPFNRARMLNAFKDRRGEKQVA